MLCLIGFVENWTNKVWFIDMEKQLKNDKLRLKFTVCHKKHFNEYMDKQLEDGSLREDN